MADKVSKLDERCWDIRPHHGFGPLEFGMKPSEVAAILGQTESIDTRGIADFEETRSNCECRVCAYESDKLVCITADISQLNNLHFGKTNILELSVLSTIDLLNRRNGRIEQAQGGSLYFDEIGVAFIQFEDPSIREFLLYSSDYDHHEPLRRISLSDARDYYISGIGGDPSRDQLKTYR